jgi:hypothetical protein
MEFICVICTNYITEHNWEFVHIRLSTLKSDIVNFIRILSVQYNLYFTWSSNRIQQSFTNTVWKNFIIYDIVHVTIKGKNSGTRRRGRRRKQLLDDLKEARRYWKLKEEAQDLTLWRTQFGRGYGPLARQTTAWTETCNQPWSLFLISSVFLFIYKLLPTW